MTSRKLGQGSATGRKPLLLETLWRMIAGNRREKPVFRTKSCGSSLSETQPTMGNDAAASPNVPQAGQPERTDRKRLAEETQKEKDLAVAQVPATIPGALAVRCPHCHYSIARCEGDLLSEITCPACGSHFSLLAVEDTLAYPAAGPRTIAGFQLIEQVGMGQYGTVWKARDLQLDRLVAVKILAAARWTRPRSA